MVSSHWASVWHTAMDFLRRKDAGMKKSLRVVVAAAALALLMSLGSRHWFC